MDIKYDIIKSTKSKKEKVKDQISVEEPLEMSLKYKKNDEWIVENISITMRTPGNDEDLISGFLFNEKIIENINEIEKIEKKGETVGDYNLQNKIVATINNTKNLDIGKLKRNFLTNSSCGICGRASIDTGSVQNSSQIPEDTFQISAQVIHRITDNFRDIQPMFEMTGGVHAVALFDSNGDISEISEDVGRHNAMDKIIGGQINNLPLHERGFLLSGRISFEMMQKAAISGSPIIVAIGAPTTLAIELARQNGITLVGFVRGGRFNVYTGAWRIKN